MNAEKGSNLARILVVGGGFGALEAAFNLYRLLEEKAEITVVADEEKFLFRPNLIYVPFGKDPEDLRFSLADALGKRDIKFIHDRVTVVEPDSNLIKTEGGEQLDYDYLVLASGAKMKPAEIPGLSENANTIWSPEEMLKLRESFNYLAEQAMQGKKQSVAFLVPPNNKCSGPLYELVMMLDSWLRDKKHGARENVDITFNTFEPSYIMAFGPRIHEHTAEEFNERNINGHNDKVVSRLEKGKIIFDDGEELSADLIVAFPPYEASTQFTNLPTDDRGFIKVDLETRQVEGLNNIYAVGDTGDFPVKQAFLALLQADAASEQIASKITGKEPENQFDPVSMCIMEQFDKATFANVPLELTGDPARPVKVRENADELYKIGSGSIWRMGKKMLGVTLPYRFRHGSPFHAGPMWKTMEAGLDVMKGLFSK